MASRDRGYDREDEINNTFFIPANFTDSGRIFQGMFEVRNVIEAIVFGGGFGWIAWNLFDLEFKLKFVLVFGIAGPIGVFSLLGYHGDCMTRLVQTVFTFLKDRRKMRYRRIKTNATAESKRKNAKR